MGCPPNGPAPARHPWRPSAARATTTDAGFRRAGRGPATQHPVSTVEPRIATLPPPRLAARLDLGPSWVHASIKRLTLSYHGPTTPTRVSEPKGPSDWGLVTATERPAGPLRLCQMSPGNWQATGRAILRECRWSNGPTLLPLTSIDPGAPGPLMRHSPGLLERAPSDSFGSSVTAGSAAIPRGLGRRCSSSKAPGAPRAETTYFGPFKPAIFCCGNRAKSTKRSLKRQCSCSSSRPMR
jgi:hypothetical protein